MDLGHKQVWFVLGFLIVILAVGTSWPVVSQLLGIHISSTPTDPATTPPSAYVEAQLAKSTGAEYLVSYTDNGFEPADLTVEQYLTVRFTNNSSNKLWVALVGSQPTPELSAQECDESASSCYAIPPYEFWEHTFTESGTFQYENTLSGKTVTITVAEEQ